MKLNKIIIGLEVHAELRTKTKMFCGCPSEHFGKEPNTQTCPVCLGLPGALPVPNKKAIEWTLLLGLAFGGEIQKNAHFDRKNYFYPDLPKGYQISQYEEPFILGGKVILESRKEIRIRRIHLEEDTAKLLHHKVEGENVTLIDFNRSGVPLVEIVSEPDLNSSEEAKEYLEKIYQVVKYLGISDADMEKGSMRLEPNVNLEIDKDGQLFYTPIVELKNINSFRFARKAIDYEVDRQLKKFENDHLEKGRGNKETRGWNEEKGETVPQREKEEASDYRYFPEPDIPPFEFSEKEIKNYELRITNYELPEEKRKRFVAQYQLSQYQAKILTDEKETADFYEDCVRVGVTEGIGGVEVANTIINKRASENLKPEKLIEYILFHKTISTVSEEEIDKTIDKLLSDHPVAIEGYKKGKIQALGMIVGLVKKETGALISIDKIKERIRN